MRLVEQAEFQTARRVQPRYGESSGWLKRHIKNHAVPLPIKFGSVPDGQHAGRIADRSSPRKSASSFWRFAWIGRNAELGRITGNAS